MTDIPNFRFPGSKSDLERRITQWGKELGLPVSWLRHYISSSVLVAMLGRIEDTEGNHLFVLKGGTSMLVRFGTYARATKDFDTAFRGLSRDISNSLSTAFSEPLWRFKATFKESGPLEGDRLQVVVHRFRVSLEFSGDAFSLTNMEVTEQNLVLSEKVTASLDLMPVRLPRPTNLELLRISEQFAEKWHACTESDRGDIANDRATDIYDLLLLLRIIHERDSLETLLEACRMTFDARDGHLWPCRITLRKGWMQVWKGLSDTQPFELLGIPTDINQAIAELNQILSHEKN